MKKRLIADRLIQNWGFKKKRDSRQTDLRKRDRLIQNWGFGKRRIADRLIQNQGFRKRGIAD